MPDSSPQPDGKQDVIPSRSARVALLVGNGAYPGQRLANPVNDARLMERVLRRLDFDVEILIDAGKAKLEQAIVRFGERIEQAGPAAASLFYFAGHGVQYMGSNYLLPTDAEIPATRYLKSGAVRVDAVVEELSRKDCEANIIILDACRHNPIPEAYSSSRDITQGLAGLHQIPDRTLVAFSTAAGSLAMDGEGPNSPYAMVLAAQLASPGRSILDIFGNVAGEVVRLTNRKQSPAIFVQGEPPRIMLQSVKVEFRKMEAAAATIGRVADWQGVTFPVGTGGSQDSQHHMAGAGVHQFFKDIADGPEMVVVPSGEFIMGADNGEGHERPRHRVVIGEPFAVGRHAVTVAQFAHFIDATGYQAATEISSLESRYLYLDGIGVTQKPGRSWRKPGFAQGPDHPVVGIHWYDAKAYAIWLAGETGQPYRLLTEAEWEYAARAGSTSRYTWGEIITREKANYDDLPELRRKSPLAWKLRARRGTCPVDIHEPNAWGLFNVHGNVAEWVEDTWHWDYDGAPTDGTAWVEEAPTNTSRVARGGNWHGSAFEVCSHSRAWLQAGWATSWIGFRVARTLGD